MKLAITGKGGVGKTTTASLLTYVFAQEGKKVIAVDANPDANLAKALGFSDSEISALTPISDLKNLIEERTGAKSGTLGSIFKLNPKVDDIPERFSIKRENIMLLVMGTVKKGNIGCLCPEGALLKSLMSHLIIRTSEIVVMDMDAGLEHLGRGTAQAVDYFIIVVEPGQRSFETARSVRNLAGDLGVKNCYIIGSKTRDEDDRKFIIDNLPDFQILGFINHDTGIAEADRFGKGVFESSSKAVEEVKVIVHKLYESIGIKEGR